MIIYLCDRCRKQFPYTQLNRVVLLSPQTKDENLGEVCPACSEGLKDFMAPLPNVITKPETQENK